MNVTERPIGETIAQLRTDFGMSRSDLSASSGVFERTIGRIENGEHLRPDWEVVVRILRGFGTAERPVHLVLTFGTATPIADGVDPAPTAASCAA